MRRGVLIPLFTGLLLSGCKEPTQVLVSIQTDYLQSDMPEIVVRVVTPTGEEVDDLRITRGISAPTEPPWTFGILREDDATTPLTVIATGIMNAQVVATATRSITTFEKGQLV